ncbi:hypothetical protein [Catenovulum maritimum]|uniref:hypothetical protein n=1 Tax=Catenovulum maritimum TaxID=1513271 RepID=UPI0012B572B1|nr:hypothetical protein [Catenovulum maritimum]
MTELKQVVQDYYLGIVPLLAVQKFYMGISPILVSLGYNPDAPVVLNKVTRT